MPKHKRVKYKKAPGAPRRFKSAYMFYSTDKHKEIRKELDKDGKKEKTTTIAKMVSEAWKAMTPEERQPFEDLAREDKARYELESSTYTGPWKIPARRRATKDKDAPKRPMSAFLSYSHVNRATVRAKHPEKDNIEVSRVLAKMWKEAPQEEKQMHIAKEAALRAKYKVAMTEWKAKKEMEEAAESEEREAAAMQKLRTMASERYQDESASHPLVMSASAASSAAAARLQAFANGTSNYNATGYSSSVPSYGTAFSSNALLARAAAAQAAAYSQAEQQSAAAALANAYGNHYNNNSIANGAYSQLTGTQPNLPQSLLGAFGGASAGGGAYAEPAAAPSASQSLLEALAGRGSYDPAPSAQTPAQTLLGAYANGASTGGGSYAAAPSAYASAAAAAPTNSSYTQGNYFGRAESYENEQAPTDWSSYQQQQQQRQRQQHYQQGGREGYPHQSFM